MKHRLNICNQNDILCALDMSLASEEKLRIWLTAIIDNELDRGEKMDEDLIMECEEMLYQLEGDDLVSRERCMEHLVALMSEVSRSNRKALALRKHRRRGIWLRVASAAAALLVTIGLFPRFQVYAQAYRDDQLYRKALNTNSHPTSDVLRKSEYSDMASFIRDYGHLNFHYPYDLKEDIQITSIRVHYNSPQSWIVIFGFANPGIKNFVAQSLLQNYTDTYSSEGDWTFPTIRHKYAITETEEDGRTLYRAEEVVEGVRYTAEAYDYNIMRYLLTRMDGKSYPYSNMEDLLAEHETLQEFLYPQSLPDRFSPNTILLYYNGTRNWSVKMNYRISGISGMNTTTLRISPTDLNNPFDPGELSPALSNELVQIYMVHCDTSSTDGLCEGICEVGDMTYQLSVYGYVNFIILAEELFGPLFMN